MLMIALGIVAAQPVMSTPQPAGPTPGQPTVEVSRDPIDDRVTAFATIRSVEGGERAQLSIGCDPHLFAGIRVMVQGRFWMARENLITGARSFRYRFDKSRPFSARFETERRTAWMDSRRRSAQFISRAQSAQQVTIRAIDTEGRELDLVFPLAGIAPAIREVSRLCNPRPAVYPATSPTATPAT